MKTLSITIACSFVLLPFLAHGQGILEAPGSNSPAPAASVDPQKDKLIRELLTKTRDVEMAETRILQGLAGMKQFMPRVPQKYWTEYRTRINLDDVRNQMVRVYDKRFSTEEIKALLQFYNTPAGKKLSAETLPILRASMDISQAVSQQAGQAVAQQLRSDQFLQAPRSAGALGLPQSNGMGGVGPNPFDAPSPTPGASPAASPAASPPAP